MKNFFKMQIGMHKGWSIIDALLIINFHCIVFNYVQNMGLPHFSAGQPSDLSHFSELTVNVFGIANKCNKPTTMRAMGTQNMKGERGCNNVASQLIKWLIDLGWLRDDKVRKHLSIIMDNCGSQKKITLFSASPYGWVNLSFFKLLRLFFTSEVTQKNLVTAYSTN